ncbi:hypothetical protein [Kribbella deserti]|uniref:Uncharacterized protein n=1 Tax=Kribbella deserti TaxID=1926257 RepID=A0ABV6QDW4_9ACTN
MPESVVVFLAGSAATLAIQWVMHLRQAQTSNEQALRAARHRLYPEFLEATNAVIEIMSAAKVNNPKDWPSTEKIQAALSAHRTVGTAVQLMSASAEVIKLTEQMVVNAGADLTAVFWRAAHSPPVQSPDPDHGLPPRALEPDHFDELMAAMKKELGIKRAGRSVGWLRLPKGGPRDREVS